MGHCMAWYTAILPMSHRNNYPLSCWLLESGHSISLLHFSPCCLNVCQRWRHRTDKLKAINVIFIQAGKGGLYSVIRYNMDNRHCCSHKINLETGPLHFSSGTFMNWLRQFSYVSVLRIPIPVRRTSLWLICDWILQSERLRRHIQFLLSWLYRR